MTIHDPVDQRKEAKQPESIDLVLNVNPTKLPSQSSPPILALKGNPKWGSKITISIFDADGCQVLGWFSSRPRPSLPLPSTWSSWSWFSCAPQVVENQFIDRHLVNSVLTQSTIIWDKTRDLKHGHLEGAREQGGQVYSPLRGHLEQNNEINCLPLTVNCPSRWSLNRSLALCVDHSNREMQQCAIPFLCQPIFKNFIKSTPVVPQAL